MKSSQEYDKKIWNFITIFAIIYVMGFVITPKQMKSTTFIDQGMLLSWGLQFVNNWWTILITDIVEGKDPYQASLCNSIMFKLRIVSIIGIIAFWLAYNPVTKQNNLISSFIGSTCLVASFVYLLREAFILHLPKKQA